MDKFQQTNEGITFKVKVIPKSSRNEILAWENDELKVRLAAVPEKGEANDELVRFLAKILSIGSSNVILIRGDKSRHKMICVKGVPLAKIQEKLLSSNHNSK
jgi:uncharacterized protein (TIGR00251 family)